ncbi:hypothetical protein HU200_032013 [Digitaria exilis]|uniref:MLO-like protein n=1 Tax=Digitaria exilis TaxID=1010633 RepID=A0A835BNG8_9POAL|nr:hypothetical protein HU200_032013 [Digitaria exilis]
MQEGGASPGASAGGKIARIDGSGLGGEFSAVEWDYDAGVLHSRSHRTGRKRKEDDEVESGSRGEEEVYVSKQFLLKRESKLERSPASSDATLEDTPTWIVASVCSVIVLISLIFERGLHHLGKVSKPKPNNGVHMLPVSSLQIKLYRADKSALERRRVTLYEALLKLKEGVGTLLFVCHFCSELMMLGFISLLLVVFQNLIQKICIDESLMEHWLPCRGGKKAAVAHYVGASSTFAGGGRRLLTGGAAFGHCLSKIHIFIFVLAITHVALSAVTVLLGLLQHAVSQGEGGVVMRLSDELFWLHSPRLVLVLIHFILFQNAFDVIVQVLCSYSTLPLYAIVSHMGSSFKSAVFADDVADHLRGWADEARQRMRRSATTGNAGCLGAAAAGRRWEAAGGGILGIQFLSGGIESITEQSLKITLFRRRLAAVAGVLAAALPESSPPPCRSPRLPSSSTLMSLRRFLYLVADDCVERGYSLRRIDMSRFFFKTPSEGTPTPLDSSGEAGATDPLATEDSGSLPDPVLSFRAAQDLDQVSALINFVLFDKKGRDGENSKVVTIGHTGRTLMCDPSLPPSFLPLPMEATHRSASFSLTVGSSLYVMDAVPKLFEMLSYGHCFSHLYKSWYWQSLPLPPNLYGRGDLADCIESYAVVDGTDILLSNRDKHTFRFDTVKGTWRKAGDWAMPFRRLAEYVPEHKLWFGISCKGNGYSFLAANLMHTSDSEEMVSPPVVWDSWNEYVQPPPEWSLAESHAVHLGSSKFCIIRFFHVGELCVCTVTHRTVVVEEELQALLTGVESSLCPQQRSDDEESPATGMPEETSLEGTPTWVVAAVCSVIVLISLVFERALHHLGKVRDQPYSYSSRVQLHHDRADMARGELVVQALEHRKKETLYEALLKLKEGWHLGHRDLCSSAAHLMLLGFVSLLLVVFQDAIREICIDERLMERWLPCRRPSQVAHHRSIFSIFGDGAGARRMLGGTAASGHCSREGEVPLLSLHALEQIHIFIFVLAITHVVLSAVTVLLGLLQVRHAAVFLANSVHMRKWMHWENAIQEEGDSGRRMLLLLIGAKLEHIINKLAYEVATKNFATDEENTDMVLSPSDELFWFQSPRLVLTFIHIILFQNAFEFAYFFWTLVLCSYGTLPLYAIVTHVRRPSTLKRETSFFLVMGSSFKSAVFADDVAEHIRGWADGARRRNRLAATAGDAGGLGIAAEEPIRLCHLARSGPHPHRRMSTAARGICALPPMAASSSSATSSPSTLHPPSSRGSDTLVRLLDSTPSTGHGVVGPGAGGVGAGRDASRNCLQLAEHGHGFHLQGRPNLSADFRWRACPGGVRLYASKTQQTSYRASSEH